jgi:SH3-like domain-containing protein
VIASHYAVPLERRVTGTARLMLAPADTSEVLAELEPGATLRILDKRGGWAWGYAEGLVGYVPAAALSA